MAHLIFICNQIYVISVELVESINIEDSFTKKKKKITHIPNLNRFQGCLEIPKFLNSSVFPKMRTVNQLTYKQYCRIIYFYNTNIHITYIIYLIEESETL